MQTENTRSLIYQALSTLLEKTRNRENESSWSKTPIIKEDKSTSIKEYLCMSDIWTTWKIELQEDKVNGETESTIYIRSEDECCPYFISGFCKVLSNKDIAKDDYDMASLFDELIVEAIYCSEDYILSDDAYGMLTTYIASATGKNFNQENEAPNHDPEAVGNCIKPGGVWGSFVEDEELPF